MAKSEPHVGPREGVGLDDFERATQLGFGRTQELPPRRHVGEQRAHCDRRAPRPGDRLDRQDLSRIDQYSSAFDGFLGRGDEFRSAHRCDRRQGLSAEAQTGDAFEIVEARDLRCRVAIEGEECVGAIHPDPVVGDADAPPSARLEIDLQGSGGRVESVFDQFLDHRCRPLDDLAGGDLAGEVIGQDADRRHRRILWMRAGPGSRGTALTSLPVPIMRFRELTLRGVGGTGSVYRAWDPLLERWVALKIVEGVSAKIALRILREARAQAQIEHPNLCRVYEVLREGDRTLIAMQFVEGPPIDELVDRLSSSQILELIAQAADALAAAHAHGLVHGDVKPGNILIETRHDAQDAYHPVVVDFGLARRTHEGSVRESAVRGTPAFMAPEQVLGGGRKEIGPATDIYGLTATLYDLLLGRPPHLGANVADTLVRVVRDTPQPGRAIRADLPRDVEAILAKGLAYDPADRYASARELAADLRAHLTKQPVSARRTSLLRRARAVVHRHPARAVAATLGTLAGALAIAWFLQTRLDDERIRTAQRFGRRVEEAAARLRYAALLPIHDVSAERAATEREMLAIGAEMQRLGPSAEGPGNYALGLAQLALGREHLARQHLMRAWEAGERGPEVAAALGRAFGALYKAALLDLQRPGLQADPTSVEEARNEFLSPALAFLTTATAAQPDALYLQGLRAFYENRFADSERLARQAQLSEGSRPEALQLIAESVAGAAEISALEGRIDDAGTGFETARQGYRQLLAVVPSDAALWTAACLVEARRANRLSEAAAPASDWRQAALDACGNAHRVAADFADAWIVEARVHWVEGQLQERRGESPLLSVEAGLASLDRALASTPASEVSPSVPTIASALHRLQASWESGHGADPRAALGRAVEAARRAIDLQSGRGSAHNNLGSALYVLALHTERQAESTGHLEAATQAFTRCVEVNPNLAACRVNLGNCWKERAEREQTAGGDPTIHLHRAILAYEGALPLSPKLGALQNNLGNVHLTLAERELDSDRDPTANLDRARAYYLKAMELRQRYAIAALNLGSTERFRLRYLLAHGQDGAGALAESRRALALAGEYNPEDVDVPLEQARLELLVRDRARFDRALRQATRINAAAPEIEELREEWR